MASVYWVNNLFALYNQKVIYRDQINRLSDEEKGALLYVLNQGDAMKVDIGTVAAYKLPALQAKLRAGASLIKEEHLEFYRGLCSSFDVTL